MTKEAFSSEATVATTNGHLPKMNRRGRRLLAQILVLGLFGVPACGGRVLEVDANDVTMVDDAGGSDVRPGAPINPFSAGSVWIGEYTCPQGVTQVELKIVTVTGNQIEDALFDFDYAGQTSGSFHLSGRFEPDSHRAVLDRGAWVSRPRGWNTVGMDGAVDVTGTTYAGTIVSSGCGAFRLTRS